jgi:4-diphosphocytidyl-2-C-methyl-D-erythritol kinase
VSLLNLHSPAKINLFLAVVGRRADGFHDLVSVVAPLEYGDHLEVERGAGSEVVLTCTDPELPVDEDNLVVRAAKAFREATGWRSGIRLRLTKRLPVGAGLGGGSSNATATLRLLNTLAGRPLDERGLESLAAGLGSDCPLFLREGPLVMRGRGERLESLPADAVARLGGRRILLLKPPFGISTPWAYSQLAARAPEAYTPEAVAERELAAWLADPGRPAEALLRNSFVTVVHGKHLALPALAEAIAEEFGLVLALSGSGSASFVLLPDGWTEEDSVRLRALAREAWGDTAWVVETRLARPPGRRGFSEDPR